jgi:hypothetical protein
MSERFRAALKWQAPQHSNPKSSGVSFRKQIARTQWALRTGRRLALNSMDPSPWILDRQLAQYAVPSADVVCIYRQRNGKALRRYLDSLGEAIHTVRLWALDEPHRSLRELTIGTGAGERLALLNHLESSGDRTDRDTFLLVTDDDVALSPRAMRRFLKTSLVMKLDLAQPAHSALSHSSWDFTCRRAGTLLRWTGFVEQGPVVLFSPRARATCFPLDESLGMGWGIEVSWSADGELSKGIVDAAQMRHTGEIAGGYSRSNQDRQLREILEQNGLSAFADLHVTHDSWQLWSSARTRLPWLQ